MVFVYPASDLVVEKSVDDSEPGYGSHVIWTITVSNNGPDDANDVVVASTGVIGPSINIEPIASHIGVLKDGLSRDGGHSAAVAIMTTDTVSKPRGVYGYEFVYQDFWYSLPAGAEVHLPHRR